MVLCVLPDCAKAQCLLDNKFGAAYDSVANLINTAKSLSIDIVGVSFHVGSHCQAQSYLHALRLARRVFDDLLEAGYHPDVVDIGGGFPGNNDDAISFEEIAQVVVSSLDEYFPLASGVRIIAEPGRYMVTRAFTLMTSVIGKHVVCDFEHVNCTDEHSPRGTSGNQNASITRFSYYLSDGVYGSFNSLFFNHCSRRAGVAKSVPDTAPVFHSILFGPTFDALDCVAQDAMLPELSVGDWLYFENMGAYSLVCASEFNGMPRAARFYVINKTDVALFRHELAATIAQEGVAVSPDLLALVGEALLQVSPVSEARMKVDTSSCALLNNESAHVKCQIANCYFSTFPASIKTSSTESVDAKAVEQLEKLVDAAQSHTTTVSVTRADASRSNEPADPDSLVQEPAFTILLE